MSHQIEARPVIVATVFFVAIVMALSSKLIAGEQSNFKDQRPVAVGQEIEGYQLTISVTNNTFVLGQSLELTISLKNVGTNDGRIRVWDGYSNYSFKFTDPRGNDVQATETGAQFLYALPKYHTGSEELSPGQSYEMPAHLNQLFQMTNIGEYKITVSRQAQKRDNQQESVWVPSAPLKNWITEPQKRADSSSTNAIVR